MTFLRSLAFNVAFYANLILQLIFFSPVFFFVREETAWRIVKNWAKSSLWLLAKIVGTRSVLTGQEHIPSGGAIIASKHQSFWEIFALLPEIERPTFILKKELMAIPLFGAFARRMNMIPVDRAKRGGAINAMVSAAEVAVRQGRQIVIFPEGTRTAPGAEVEYRQGVFRLYEALGLPVVPVALNSGLCWPRNSFIKKKGTIRAEFLPVLPSGLGRQEFLDALRSAIESRSRELSSGRHGPHDPGSKPAENSGRLNGIGDPVQS
ncbi:lysophospholipid acyltransferase family protein [Jiella marina]|uniref:lysophospholipid acyltransferase family protein n=1 Tax=Jiella sp. LLJ827 TaxID=2917712 RepID=UPI00210194E1|nr:lysophospholipid acyltransferase family protein [Jiella sp. LLJ827]MCQ0990051.1 1-acyl-sn-glycerol-3-phosphate acyltransferase [Jiella sp. LLJ827]